MNIPGHNLAHNPTDDWTFCLWHAWHAITFLINKFQCSKDLASFFFTTNPNIKHKYPRDFRFLIIVVTRVQTIFYFILHWATKNREISSCFSVAVLPDLVQLVVAKAHWIFPLWQADGDWLWE